MKEMMHSGTACLAMLALASTVAYAADHDATVRAKNHPSEESRPLESKPLSTPLLSHVEYPSDRPAWINETTNLNSQPQTCVVLTQPAETLDECRQELAVMRRAAVRSYIEIKSNCDRFDFFPINDQWIDERLVSRTYQGQVVKGGSNHYEMAVELTFPPGVENEIMDAWRRIQVRDRLGAMGVTFLIGLSSLVCISMFLSALSRRNRAKEDLRLVS